MKEKLLLAAAALLGFATACDSNKRQTDMYGTPYNNYKIKGKVTPEATTAADGTYDLAGQGFGNMARVTFTDTDGPANGGDFAEKTVDIKFTEAERTAQGKGWDQGSFAKSGVDETLEEKK